MRRRAVLLLLMVLTGHPAQAEEPDALPLPLPADLTAAIGQEQVLGFDYLSDVIPSTSDCLGNNLTLPCSVATKLACLAWNDPHACTLVHDDARTYLQGARGGAVPMPSLDSPSAFSRIRYAIIAAARLDETLVLPWLDPARPEFDLSRYKHAYLSNQPAMVGDIALVVWQRTCVPGGEACVATMAGLRDLNRDICIQIDPCYGPEVMRGQVWRMTENGWIIKQNWRLDDHFR